MSSLRPHGPPPWPAPWHSMLCCIIRSHLRLHYKTPTSGIRPQSAALRTWHGAGAPQTMHRIEGRMKQQTQGPSTESPGHSPFQGTCI